MKINDAVSVLDEDISGVITEINKDIITIKDSDGFEYQYSKKELVLDKNNLLDITINQQTFSEILTDKETKRNKNSNKVKPKERKLPPMEVDLHIHQLVSNSKGMDNFDMLNYQLDTARRKIAFAISKKIQRIVFIHGVGEGVLRYELYRVLKEYEGQLKFYDADYQKYGIGATEVYIYQNKKN